MSSRLLYALRANKLKQSTLRRQTKHLVLCYIIENKAIATNNVEATIKLWYERGSFPLFVNCFFELSVF